MKTGTTLRGLVLFALLSLLAGIAALLSGGSEGMRLLATLAAGVAGVVLGATILQWWLRRHEGG
jgi:uncharacterized membrane protein YeaQ/YmgE (transglycosylase-associated protein family)